MPGRIVAPRASRICVVSPRSAIAPAALPTYAKRSPVTANASGDGRSSSAEWMVAPIAMRSARASRMSARFAAKPVDFR